MPVPNSFSTQVAILHHKNYVYQLIGPFLPASTVLKCVVCRIFFWEVGICL